MISTPTLLAKGWAEATAPLDTVVVLLTEKLYGLMAECSPMTGRGAEQDRATSEISIRRFRIVCRLAGTNLIEDWGKLLEFLLLNIIVNIVIFPVQSSDLQPKPSDDKSPCQLTGIFVCQFLIVFPILVKLQITKSTVLCQTSTL
jgi:hypothetical protein